MDTNHGRIVEALTAMGWGVKSLAQLGQGMPDLVIVKHGRIVLIEVKDGAKSPSRRRLTADEADVHAWFKRYGVEVLLVTAVEDLQMLDRVARTQFEAFAKEQR